MDGMQKAEELCVTGTYQGNIDACQIDLDGDPCVEVGIGKWVARNH